MPDPNCTPGTRGWRYKGKHRGTYQYWPDVNGNIARLMPYGVRHIKITPYVYAELTGTEPAHTKWRIPVEGE